MTITRESLLAAGYKAFTQKNLKSYTESFYQKRFDDERGKRYFITIAEYDNRQYQDHISSLPDFSYSPEAQFTEANGTTFNVEMLWPKSVKEMEDFFESLWLAMSCEHYERNYEETNEN